MTVAVTTNQPPLTGADEVTVVAGSSVTFDPLVNDSDPEGSTLTLVSVTGGAAGTAMLTRYIPPALASDYQQNGSEYSSLDDFVNAWHGGWESYFQYSGNPADNRLLVQYTSTDPGFTGTDTLTYVVADAAGSISLINARGAAMFGYTMAELTGHPLEVLLPERHRDQHEQHRAGYAAHPTARFMGVGRDLTALHRDGSEFPVEIGLNVYNDGSGPKVVATINDITARKQAEQALLQANADLDEFTYVASHDLKSPVRGIGSLLEWIEEDLGDDIADEVKHNLDRARIRVERMQQLIDDLLSYARAGRAQDVFDHVDLRALIDEIIETLDVPATFSVSADLLDQAVFTSKTPLATVLRNLVSNAVKHHDRQHGEVRIRQFRRGAFLVFEVSDDGPGIPSAAHARICKLFQTLSHDSKGPRSGVGLAVCKRLIQASGGVLEIDSCEQQRGSVFRFTWPLVKRRDLHGSD